VHVVVVGCGRVGSALALNLVESGHTVSIIDKRSEAFARLGPNFGGKTLTGIGFDRDRLIEAGIRDAAAVASVTSGDNSNILVARVARETFGIERVVARIYDPRRAAIYQRLGIATVATVAWTTERVLRRIVPDTPAVEWLDPSANVSLVERSVGTKWVGHRVDELEIEGGLKVVALSRLGVSQIPKPNLVVQDGDVVYLAVSGDALGALDERLTGPGKGH
jgi:trk system potassium uptake protein